MKTITLTFIVPDDAYCPECSQQLDIKPEDFIEAGLDVKCGLCGEILSLCSDDITCNVQ